LRFQSLMRPIGVVTAFPEHTGERVYMAPFTKAGGLPDQLARWQPTVDQMMAEVETDATCYIMIDQGIVEPGKAMRREGIHIDGYWHGETLQSHGSSSSHLPAPTPGWGSTPSGHRPAGVPFRPLGHVSVPIHRAISELPKGGKRKKQRIHDKDHDDSPEDWSAATFDAPEAIILASDLRGCVGYVGEFEGPIGQGGDCSHVDLSTLTGHTLVPDRVYAGNVTFLHESVPIVAGPRTLVRINVPGWTP